MAESGVISNRKYPQPAERKALRFGLILSLLLAIVSGLAWGDEAYSMKPTSPRASAHFPQSLVNALSRRQDAEFGNFCLFGAEGSTV